MENVRETLSNFFKNFISFVKTRSRDFSKIKKRVAVELCRNKKEFLHKIVEKLWGELK